jgi:MFS-type transporter involved in bile tolerance (Atg22 family)
MNRIMGYVVNANWNELLKDGSIEQRINGITQSFSVLIANRGLPNGFGGDRYFSGVGILIAEGGFISILLLCVIGKIIYDAYPRKYRFIFVFGFMVTMLSSIPFSSPIVCFYLGYCLYMGSESKKKVTGDCDERI